LAGFLLTFTLVEYIIKTNQLLETKMDFPVQTALELACAAQRYNKCYQKESRTLYSDDGKIMGHQYSNKLLILFTLDVSRRNGNDPMYLPSLLQITDEDRKKVDEIRSYYRRLMFSIMSQPDNNFLQEVHSLLNKEIMNENKIGFIACLPSTYERDSKRNDVSKILKQCSNSYLAEPESKLNNLSARVIECTRSKNFDAFNVLAVVDDKLVSWFSKVPVNLGDKTIISAKVKGNSEHWFSKKSETRLNYVKVKNENSSNE
jgi:hypothetical protein